MEHVKIKLLNSKEKILIFKLNGSCKMEFVKLV